MKIVLTNAKRTIKDFFEKVLGITEFDGRSWHKIILEEGS